MTNANVHIGEQAVHVWGRDFVFRPLFNRVAQLGTPKEILELFNQVQHADDDGFIAAWRVLSEFCDEKEIDNLIGYFYFDEKISRLRYVRGKMSADEIHVIGCSMLTDAIIGRPSKRDKAKASKEKPASEFNPAEFVAIGVALIGGTPESWWNSTMIELQNSLKAKNPEKEDDQDQIDEKEIEDLFKEIDRIKAAKGVH